MSVELPIQASNLFNEACDYAIAHIAPFAAQWEEAMQLPREAVVHAAAHGYCGIGLTREVGGRGLKFLESALVYEGLAHGCGGFTFLLQLHNNISYDIETYYDLSAEVKKLLPGMACGKNLTAFALTEECGGSDPSMNQSYAELRQDGYHLFGRKVWITNAVDAEHLVVFVRNGTAKNMLIFLVDRGTPGLLIGKNHIRTGGNVMSCADLTLEDCVVSEARLMSADGFREALRAINVARIFVPAIAIGIAQRSIDLTVEYLGGRHTFGKPIISNQGVQWTLAELEAQVEAGRWLVYRTASLMDTGADVISQAAMNKLYTTNLAMKVTTECAQLFGANGLARDSAIARFMAVAKMLQLVDGTSEIQRIIIGRSLERRAMQGR